MEKVIYFKMPIEELVCLISDSVVMNLPIVQSSEVGFLTRVEAAKKLRISLGTLHNHTKSGVIPSYRIGSRVLYKIEDIETYINLNKPK